MYFQPIYHDPNYYLSPYWWGTAGPPLPETRKRAGGSPGAVRGYSYADPDIEGQFKEQFLSRARVDDQEIIELLTMIIKAGVI